MKKLTTKIGLCSVFLSLFLLTGMSSYAQSGGTGTQADPFQLSTPADLQSINNHLGDPNVFFKLTADIDLTGEAEWTPIGVWHGDGTVNEIFLGTLDGDGHVIKNLIVTTASATDDAGFFRGLNGPAVIKNLGFTGVDALITGRDRALTGTLAGYASAGPDLSPVQITNCYSTVEVIGGRPGGLIGLCNGSIVSKCFATGNVTANLKAAGGLIGELRGGGTVSDCYATGNITVQDTGEGWDCGGLIGVTSNAGTSITNSYATGVITASQNTGGIVGTVNDGTLVDYCFALNPSLTSSRANRIVAINLPISTTNFALADMVITADIHDAETTIDNVNGQDKSIVEATSQATYGANGLNWDFTNTWVWPSNDYKLPILKGLANQPTSTPSHLQTTGLKNATATGKLSVYPNPTVSDVTINAEEVINSLKLYDVTGKLLSLPAFKAGENKLEIKLSAYKKGIYFLNVNGSAVKIIKE